MVTVAMLPILGGVVAPVRAQDGEVAPKTSAPESVAPEGRPVPQASILLQQLTGPRAPAPRDSVTRDDLRDLPTPRADRLSESSRIIIVVGDPRCFPGEEFIPLPPPPRVRRR